jgi:hypothetical protein
VELVFFEAQGRADFGQIDDKGRVLPCTEEKAGSLTVWSRICRRRQGYGSQAFLGKFGMRKPSQQTLNCALSVDLL